MARLPKLIRHFVRDRAGNIAILAAVFSSVLMGVGALGIDTGKVFLDRRKAQSVTDLAALAAVSDLANASKAATATVARNNFDVGNPLTVELGTYTASPSVAPSARFQPAAAASANAARVTFQTSSSLTFGAAILGRNSFAVTTQAIATQSAFATFAIGSRLAQIDGGLLNSLLGGMLGSSISLSVMDYNALIAANVDLFDFMNTLATRVGVTAGTYDTLLSGQIKVTDFVAAMADTVRSAGGSAAANALSAIGQGLQGATNKVLMRSTLDAGPYSSLSLGQRPRVSAAVSAFDLVSGLAQIANGQHQIQIPLNLNIAGLAGVTLALAVGERPQGKSWITVGSTGASVNTAQTRLLLTATVNGAGAIANVSVPIYIELASATARLSAVACNFANGTASNATLDVTPSLIDAWIGAVLPTDFVNFRSTPSPAAAAMVSLPLVQVTGRAHVAVTNMSATPVTFTMADINARTRKTVGTSNYSASLISSLLGNTQLNVTIAGLGLGLGGGAVSSLVSGILTAAATPLDSAISTVLSTLGLGLGQADVWITGLRCDGAVLVN
jgi:uncharacterized membrane protein